MEGDDGKCEGYQTQPVCLELRMNREDDASHNASQTEHAYAWHDALDQFEVFSLAQEIVECDSKRHGQKRHEQDVLEHPPSIHVNLRPCKPKDEKWRHNGRKTGADGCHADTISHIAFAKETHDVAAHPSGTAAYQYDACRHERIEVEYPSQCPRHKRHDGVLRDASYQYVDGSGKQDAEVLGGERAAHRQHDEAENDGCPLPLLHPSECLRKEETDDCNQYDEQARVAGEPTTYGKEDVHKAISSIVKE